MPEISGMLFQIIIKKLEMKIAISGHRPNKLGNDYELKSELMYDISAAIEDIIHTYNPTKLITGMALGIDTLFARIAIANEIPFIAAIPFVGQEKMWPQKSRTEYFRLINHPLCEKVLLSTDSYSPKAMQDRNKWMVDHADMLIAVWDGTLGGTNNCVQYAISKKPIIRINPAILPIKSEIIIT